MNSDTLYFAASRLEAAYWITLINISKWLLEASFPSCSIKNTENPEDEKQGERRAKMLGKQILLLISLCSVEVLSSHAGKNNKNIPKWKKQVLVINYSINAYSINTLGDGRRRVRKEEKSEVLIEFVLPFADATRSPFCSFGKEFNSGVFQPNFLVLLFASLRLPADRVEARKAKCGKRSSHTLFVCSSTKTQLVIQRETHDRLMS